ncbi:MAG: tetratricopeptide repeat protein [Bacteroidia bacterium]|nr:tetratricopeptide repeat protein [Bacteroidia bacterium]
MCNIFAQHKVLDSLKKSLETHTQRDTSRIHYLISVGKYIMRTEKEKSLQYATEAVQIAEDLKNVPMQIKSYIHLAKMYSMQDKYTNAIEYYQKAALLCEKVLDTINLAEIYFGIATIYRFQEKYRKAEQYNLRALSILNHPKYDLLKAKIYNNMGILYDRQKNHKKAIEFHEKSVAIKERLKDTLGMLTTLANLVITYSQNGKVKNETKAQDYLQKVEQIAKRLKDDYTIRYVNLYLGKIYLEEKKLDRAMQYCKKAIELYKNDKPDDIHLDALITKCSILIENNDIYSAQRELLPIVPVVSELKNIQREKEVYQLLAKIYQKQDKYKESCLYYQKESAIKDTLFTRYKKQEEQLAENDYELMHIEQMNQNLKSLNQLQQERLRKQGITIAFVVLALTLASALAILLVYVNSARNHYLKKLEERNQIISNINAELQKNNQIKSKLFSIISHDLRSPLATTKGLLMLLKEEPNLSDQFKIYINQITKNLDNTFILLDNLLKWSAAQMQNVKPKPSHFSIQNLIHEIVELYTPTAQEKKIELTADITNDYTVYADRDMLHLVLRNLVNNAIKFTPENGKIQVSVTKQDKSVLISIKDTGIGIPEKHIQKIFEGLTTRGTASEKGTGLGLQLCKEFIQLNQGELTVQSIENVGSTFSFTVPLSEKQDLV